MSVRLRPPARVPSCVPDLGQQDLRLGGEILLGRMYARMCTRPSLTTSRRQEPCRETRATGYVPGVPPDITTTFRTDREGMSELAPSTPDGSLPGHWRWRPDWTEGRGCLWWYLTFEDQSELHAAVQQTNRHLSGLTALDLVPSRWLHLTLREIGYVDELPAAAAANALAEARRSLSSIEHFKLYVGPLAVLPGALVLRVSPEQAVHRLRARLPGNLPALEARDGLPAPDAGPPHVSIGYLRSDIAADTLPTPTPSTPTVSVKVCHVTLAEVTRRNWRYEWSPRGLVSLTPGARTDEV